MEVLTTPEDARTWSSGVRRRHESIGVVPTMGALHAGHLELVELARETADHVVVTIFVNPLQFNQRSDFDSYPRPIDGDLEVCRTAGVSAVYAPTAAVMYPPNYQTHVEPGALADRLEGPMRPGHFRGVSTVVLKLFAATQPHVAVFGQKDYQQLAIIRQMVADFDLGLDIVAAPISREADGLARSSRNVRLDAEQRRAAPVLSRALVAAWTAWRAGEHQAAPLILTARRMIEAAPHVRLEYVEFVDAVTLESVDDAAAGGVMLTAAWFGEVRLIDNHVFSA